MRAKIKAIIASKLSSIYCNNCVSNQLDEDDDENHCDECARKQMGWSISPFTVQEITDEIIKELGNE